MQPEHPAGSPRLTVPSIARKRCIVTERLVEETWLYDLVPKDAVIAEAAKRKRIYYFCGGGFKKTPVVQHWCFVQALACAVPATVTVVSYPLAPHAPAAQSIPHLAKLYYSMMQESAVNKEEVIFMGDSAGGNIVICLPLYVVHKDSEAPLPSRVLVISPATDGRIINPEIPGLCKQDPFLSYDYIQEVSDMWSKGLDKTDPMMNNVMLDGIYGTWDLLAPDAKLLMEKAKDEGLQGSWLIADAHMHCYPLTWQYGIPEAKLAKDWIVQRCAGSSMSQA